MRSLRCGPSVVAVEGAGCAGRGWVRWEQRYRAVLEVLEDGVSVTEVARRFALSDRRCTGGCAGMQRMGWAGWRTGRRGRRRARIR